MPTVTITVVSATLASNLLLRAAAFTNSMVVALRKSFSKKDSSQTKGSAAVDLVVVSSVMVSQVADSAVADLAVVL